MGYKLLRLAGQIFISSLKAVPGRLKSKGFEALLPMIIPAAK